MCLVGHKSLPMKVVIGAVRRLHVFLHEAKNQIIYRDFKAANILLDSGQRKTLILWIG